MSISLENTNAIPRKKLFRDFNVRFWEFDYGKVFVEDMVKEEVLEVIHSMFLIHKKNNSLDILETILFSSLMNRARDLVLN